MVIVDVSHSPSVAKGKVVHPTLPPPSGGDVIARQVKVNVTHVPPAATGFLQHPEIRIVAEVQHQRRLTAALQQVTSGTSVIWARMLSRLHRVFDVSPQPALAALVEYGGKSWSWQVTGEQLIIEGIDHDDQAKRLVFVLQDYSIATLAAALTESGFVVSGVSADYSGLSALSLVPGAGNSTMTNGNHLFVYTNMVWGLFRAWTDALVDLASEIRKAIAQIYFDRAEGEFLDQHGYYYGIARKPGESDAAYFARMIATILMARNNNVAIQLALAQYLMVAPSMVKVIDAATATASDPTFYNGEWLYDGSLTYNGWSNEAVGNSNLAQFYVVLPEQVLATATLSEVIAVINLFKAAGTRLVDVMSGTLLTYDGSTLYSGAQVFDGIKH